MVTTQQVADFFEIEIDAVQKCYQRNKEELDGNGVVFLTPTRIEELIGHDVQLAQMKRLYCVGENAYFEVANRGTKMFPPRAILNLAMLLPNSHVPREVRNQLLNITENAVPEERVAEIVREQDMQLELGKAFSSGILWHSPKWRRKCKSIKTAI